ncbi:hypothetical protein BRC82_10440 [Halobacteriales archaeon QS_1_67_19]|nr:MAG: hypothetical protein BRC82_10440 [Halobacteriales archaeon QS_1_67_19]
MNPAKFALLLGVGLLAFLFVEVLYVIWTRIVGLDPTIAQRFAALSSPVRAAIAAVSGVGLGTASLFAPSVASGVAGIVMFGASAFTGLVLFELARQRERAGI